MTRPSTPTSPSPLFSLPRIPYYFTVIPYPLTCPKTSSSPLAGGTYSMKRRFGSDGDRNEQRAAITSNQSTSNISAQQYNLNPQQQQQQQGYTYPPDTGSPEERDSGPDSIEGRVLKRMRRIKLDSMSPPAEVSSPQEDLFRNLSPTILDLDHSDLSGAGSTTLYHQQQQHPVTEGKALFSPVKISTRSSFSSQGDSIHPSQPQPQLHVHSQTEQDTSGSQQGPVENAAYSGMNILLHQIHASRFGIPDENDLGSNPLYHHQQHQQHQYNQQEQQQQQLEDQRRQYEQQLQQPQPRQFQSGMPTYMTAWHQVPPRTTHHVDEDDEMTGIEDASGSTDSALLLSQGANLARFSTHHQNQLHHQQDQPQEHVLTPLQEHQHLQGQDQTQQQQLQQQHSYSSQGPNLYQDINAQLRAAFLARAETEQRYR
ncbi:hypothetical protein BGZ83_002076 [Gryganskiella cystojenkinii]|nr:hypothetical protein BGZ83_002076 [Gryganskiella cystojenkinii]